MGRMTSTSGCSESVTVGVVGGGGGAGSGAAVNNQEVMFPPGAIVRLNILNGRVCEGEILSFDLSTKMLVLLVGTKPNVRLTFINIAFVTDSRITKEPPPTGSSFVARSTFEKAKLRLDEAIDRKRRSLPTVPVSSEGLSLFKSISQTHYKVKDLYWEGDRIVFQNLVVVCPPFGTDDVQPVKNARHGEHHASCALDQLRKQVEKFWRNHRSSSVVATQAADSSVSDVNNTNALSKSQCAVDDGPVSSPTFSSADSQPE